MIYGGATPAPLSPRGSPSWHSPRNDDARSTASAHGSTDAVARSLCQARFRPLVVGSRRRGGVPGSLLTRGALDGPEAPALLGRFAERFTPPLALAGTTTAPVPRWGGAIGSEPRSSGTAQTIPLAPWMIIGRDGRGVRQFRPGSWGFPPSGHRGGRRTALALCTSAPEALPCGPLSSGRRGVIFARRGGRFPIVGLDVDAAGEAVGQAGHLPRGVGIVVDVCDIPGRSRRPSSAG